MIFKIKNIITLNKTIKILLIFCLFFLLPINAYSAELLQIRDSKTILVGDQNRTLTIDLYCLDVDESKEALAIERLKEFFPRGIKVKVRPYGVNDDKLLAKIFTINEKYEMTDLLEDFNLLNEDCNY